jgi:hypothetical protein
MESIELLNLLPTLKESGEIFKASIKRLIEDGETDIFSLSAKLAFLSKNIDELRKDVDLEEKLLTEALKEDKKTFKSHGVEFQIKEVGVAYDFSVCDDQELNDYLTLQATYEEKIKARKDFLKTISGEVYDANGIKLNPPVKTSKTKVTITLK